MNGGILKANNQLVLDPNGRSEKICYCEKCTLDQLSGQCSMQTIFAPLRREEFILGFHYFDRKKEKKKKELLIVC